MPKPAACASLTGEAEALAHAAQRERQHLAVGLVGHLGLVLDGREGGDQILVGVRGDGLAELEAAAAAMPDSQSISVP